MNLYTLFSSKMIFRIFMPVIFLEVAQCIPNVVFLSLTMRESGRDGYLATDPVYDVILDRIQWEHPDILGNISRVPLRYGLRHEISSLDHPVPNFAGKDDNECVSSLVSDYFFKYYFANPELFHKPLNEQVILMTTPDCMDVLHEAANFVQELPGVILMATAPNNEFANNQKYASVVNLFATPDDYFVYCLAFMAQKYGWQTLHIICQTDGKAFAANVCARVQDVLTQTRSSNVHLVRSSIDVTNETSFAEALNTAKTIRVSFVLLLPSLLRDFMIAAKKENMTNGQHIFVTCGIQGVPAQDALYWRADDKNDEVALHAFQALLIIADGVVDWNDSTEFLGEINDLYGKKYNWHLPLNETNNDNPIRLYEMLLIFSNVFGRTWKDFSSMNIADFVRAFANRTYNLPTRSVYLDSVGTMIALVPVKRLNASTTLYDTVLQIHPKTGDMIVLTDQWFEMTFLPGDFPLCGDHGEKCFATRSPDLFIAIIVLSIFVVMLLFGLCWILRRKHRKSLMQHLLVERSAIRKIDNKNVNVENFAGNSAGWTYRDQQVNLKQLSFSNSEQSIFGKTRHPLQNDRLRDIIIAVSQMSHQNIATFYGVTFSSVTECYAIFESGTKGTLASVLSTNCNAIFFDFDIRMVFATSLIEGLCYIHHSPIQYHGHLDPEVCLINHRYTLRITGVGTTHLQNIMKSSHSHIPHQNKDVKDLGDVLQFICADIQEIPPVYRESMSDCRATPPPSATQIRSKLSKGLPGKSNIDLLLDRLGKHAEDLEETVRVRSEELVHEMGKVDLLLREMLPVSIISRLRNRQTVEPEFFECATVLFSDIPSFGQLVSERPPLDIVVFLNSIHSYFDSVVKNYDVYKVETINDSYVVVSGVPARNGSKHAAEICELALQLVSIPPEPQFLRAQPRIGISSGCIAAGVVGTRMPRYCLFGDTMNTASRMESHGEASRIHVSLSTRKIVEKLETANQAHNHMINFESRGLIPIKGKGEVETFWLSRMIPCVQPQISGVL